MESKVVPKSVGYVLAFTILILMVSPIIRVQLVHAELSRQFLFASNHATSSATAAGDNLVNLTVVHDAVAKGAGYTLFHSKHFSSPQKVEPIREVKLTVLSDAVTKGAVCLDGSPSAYNFDRGHGSGANRWLINMEGGGWCNNITNCIKRSRSKLGSSLYMGKTVAFSGILSNYKSRNPYFYNWNRVFVRYCDGSSFTGDVEEVNQSTKLHFRGQRIWQAVMEDLLVKGMDKTEQALLTGCSAGGLTTIIHCDDFRNLLPKTANVKCMADAGFFVDAHDVSGGNYISSYFKEIVTLHESIKNLPNKCTSIMDPHKCFFPQNLVTSVETPVFILNAAYDSWQVRNILTPSEAIADHQWQRCRDNISNCESAQLNVLQGFRVKMLRALKPVGKLWAGGLFINSCYAHCQTNLQDLWHGPNSPKLESNTIAEAVGDWVWDRGQVKYIDCRYPCDSTCINRVFNST